MVQLGAPGETSRVLSSAEAAAIDVPGHTAADVDFVQGMLHHHRQALAMTALVDERAGRDDLALLAERMDVSQRQEIELLQAWLTERGEPLTGAHDEHVDHRELMPGMLTDEEVAQLEGARDRAFDELFLQYMIRHHEGAVAMVEELLTGGEGGQEPQVFQLAQSIGTDQQVEISRMKTVLAEIAAG